MSSNSLTGSKKEALDALPEIINLANDILSREKIQEANQLAIMLVGTKDQKKYARAKITLEIGLTPSRPLLYLMPLLQRLPRYTRDSIRYLGDYLDLLTKEITYEFVGGKARKSSLGKNAFRLKKVSEVRELAKYLGRYSNFIYTPGKHDFSLPLGRSHRFTSREVVLTTFITAELGKRILLASENARKAVEADNWYTIGGRWGSSNRVEYQGNR